MVAKSGGRAATWSSIPSSSAQPAWRCCNPVAYLPFLGFLAVGYAAQSLTREGSRPHLFVTLVIVTIAAFAWLKRYSFVPHALFLGFPYVLVGLSYVFFRVLHVIIDRHQGAIKGKIGPISYLNYALNFTSLVSGPIQRYQDYHAMEKERLPLDLVEMGNAFERIIVGYFKVAVVSALLAAVRTQALEHIAPQRRPLGACVDRSRPRGGLPNLPLFQLLLVHRRRHRRRSFLPHTAP